MRKLALLIALWCVPTAYGQVPVALAPVAHMQFLNNSGLPLASGCVFTFQAGTTNPAATYTDSTGTAQNTNPIILNAGGFADIWLPNAAFKFQVKSFGGSNCASGATLWTVDNITGVLGLLNLTNVWTASNTFSQAVAITVNANQLLLGAPGNVTTINAPVPAGNVTLILPTTSDTLVGRATADTLTNKTLTTPTITNPALTLSSIPVTNGPATYINVANSVTGTVNSRLTKLVGGLAQFMAITDVSGAIGITVAGSGGTGTTATIQQGGAATCFFDNGTTAGDYVQISSATAGSCHDTGSTTLPTSGQIIGRSLATSALVATALSLDLYSPEIVGGSIAAATGCTTIGPLTVSANNAIQTLISCTIPANALSAGNMLTVTMTGLESTAVGQTVTFTGSLGGGTACNAPSGGLGVANNQPLQFNMNFSVLTAGAGGTANIYCSSSFSVGAGIGFVAANGTVGAPTIAINTTVANTLLIQEQMSVNNAGNLVTAQLLKAVIY